jgi:glycerate 2-kinase
MRIVIAPDKFKGSLPAAEVAAQLRAGLRDADPTIEVAVVPVADGGDGTLDAAISAGFTRVEVDAFGPTGRPRPAGYGRRGDTAVIELAGTCGLTLLGSARDPLGATSYGLGAVLAHALETGIDRVIVGIGGSASTDGGAGLLTALGAQLRAADGRKLPFGGGALVTLERVELAELHPRLGAIELLVACDVDNPLCGPSGAAVVYGPQKGACADDVRVLDAGLARLAAVIAATTGTDHSGEPGAGAAGGVGFGALVLGGQLRSGIELVLDLIDFDATLAGADLVITGEGSLDEQTLAGKAPAGVAAAARRRGIPVIAVAGRNELTPAQLGTAGIERVYTLSDLEPDTARSIAAAGPLLRGAGELIGRDLRTAPDTAAGRR